MDTLFFAFEGNISGEILDLLEVGNKLKIKPSRKNCDVEDFLTYVKLNKPQKILGLGVYSGKDKSQIRLETLAKNKFRNNIIGEFEEFQLDQIVQSSYFKIARGLGNSWCNLVSYKIMNMKSSGDITSLYSFLHIPSTMDLLTATAIIKSTLKYI